MTNILLISGHPNLETSVANRAIFNELAVYPDIKIHCLDKQYPDYQINVAHEQALLSQADLIIIQFPLYWSTYPAIMKQWFDQTFTYNFAFGPEGDKLKNKKVILSITAGATEQSYTPEGFNFFPLPDYLKAAMHPAYAAQMNIIETIVTFEMNAIVEEGGDQQQVLTLAKQHVQQLVNAINNQISTPLQPQK